MDRLLIGPNVGMGLAQKIQGLYGQHIRGREARSTKLNQIV